MEGTWCRFLNFSSLCPAPSCNLFPSGDSGLAGRGMVYGTGREGRPASPEPRACAGRPGEEPQLARLASQGTLPGAHVALWGLGLSVTQLFRRSQESVFG